MIWLFLPTFEYTTLEKSRKLENQLFEKLAIRLNNHLLDWSWARWPTSRDQVFVVKNKTEEANILHMGKELYFITYGIQVFTPISSMIFLKCILWKQISIIFLVVVHMYFPTMPRFTPDHGSSHCWPPLEILRSRTS